MNQLGLVQGQLIINSVHLVCFKVGRGNGLLATQFQSFPSKWTLDHPKCEAYRGRGRHEKKVKVGKKLAPGRRVAKVRGVALHKIPK
jgi:hypothetical protein